MFSVVSQAQGLRHHALKLDLVAPSRNGLHLTYELGLKPRNSVEFQLTFERHTIPKAVEVFHGDWLNNYAEERIDTFNKFANQLVGSSGWNYRGEERPLSAVPTYVAHSTAQFAGVYRIPFLPQESKWGIFLQTGFFVTLHRYYENREKLLVLDRVTEQGSIPDFLGQERYRKHSIYLYQQQRSIRLNNHIRGGVAYQLGVSRRLGKHLLLEGRLDAGMHIGPPPYEEPAPPVVARRIPWKPAFMVGWVF